MGFTLLLSSLSAVAGAEVMLRSSQDAQTGQGNAVKAGYRDDVGKKVLQAPLSFEANRGQADPRVDFVSHGRGYTVFLTGKDAVFALGSTSGNRQRRQLAANGHAQWYGNGSSGDAISGQHFVRQSPRAVLFERRPDLA